jgi:hypothetical protein
MTTNEERQARALEGILGQLTFIVALMKKQNEPTIPPLEAAKAALNNRPGVMALLQSWGLKGPLKVEIINIHASGGDVKFAGLIDDMPGKQIEGIIKDVY